MIPFNPIVALRTGIRSALIEAPEVTALVPADHIRTGSTIPDKFPSVIITDGGTALHGDDYRAIRTAWLYPTLHVWAPPDDADVLAQIAHTIARALDRPLSIDGGMLTHGRVSDLRIVPDPDHFGHAVLSYEGLLTWKI